MLVKVVQPGGTQARRGFRRLTQPWRWHGFEEEGHGDKSCVSWRRAPGTGGIILGGQ